MMLLKPRVISAKSPLQNSAEMILLGCSPSRTVVPSVASSRRTRREEEPLNPASPQPCGARQGSCPACWSLHAVDEDRYENATPIRRPVRHMTWQLWDASPLSKTRLNVSGMPIGLSTARHAPVSERLRTRQPITARFPPKAIRATLYVFPRCDVRRSTMGAGLPSRPSRVGVLTAPMANKTAELELTYRVNVRRFRNAKEVCYAPRQRGSTLGEDMSRFVWGNSHAQRQCRGQICGQVRRRTA